MEGLELLENHEHYNAVLDKGMFYADSFVNKRYLVNLNKYPVKPLDEQYKSDKNIRLFAINKIVYDKDEISNDKLISVYSALFNINATAILLIDATPYDVSFYLGIRSEDNAPAAEAVLHGSFYGNFAGSEIKGVDNAHISKILSVISDSSDFGNENYVSSVSIVPSTRDEDKLKFVQGIEKFIDTMKGEEYTAVFLAEPLGNEILEQRKQGMLALQSSLSPFKSTQLSYGENSSHAVSKSMSENFSKTVNDSITDTNSNFESTNKGTNFGLGFSLFGLGLNGGKSKGYSQGNSWAHAVTQGTSNTEGKSVTDSDTDTTGDSRTLTVTNENKNVQYIVDKIDQHLERIAECESFGLWDVACYFVSKNVQTSVVAASTYKALMAGESSGVENSYVNVWEKQDTATTPQVLEYLRYCINPRFVVPANDEVFTTDEQIVSACCCISGKEMPYIMGLPRKSVSGVAVIEMAEFGRNVMYSNNKDSKETINLGHVHHMGRTEQGRVKLDLQNFRSHCFITGSTGSGKSNTTYQILDEMIKNKIPFLVVEPAKGEYKRYYGGLEGLNVFCTNPNYFSMLKINPFRFNEKIHVLEHLDRLIEIFNACWPLYAAMPAILKESFERAYVKCGWDLMNSIHIPNSRPKFPTFADVLEALPEIINSSSYSSDSKGDYTGALVTRVRSLTNGILGQIFESSADIDESVLFDENTIVDLSRVSSLETKSLIMGLLILKLNEYRMCSSSENQPLRHVTVLEEAHNILKRSAGGGGGMESADVQGKSVEMISASIAEMRTYGEGFIIVDQSPTAVDVSAIKNTNTKIIMRLPDQDDCEIAAKAIGLKDEQMAEISRFPMGVAAVYQSNWVEPVLTKIDYSTPKYHIDGDAVVSRDALAELRGALADWFICQIELGYAAEDGFDTEEPIKIIEASALTSYKKKEFISQMVDICTFFETNPANVRNYAKCLADIVKCQQLFEVVPFKFVGNYDGIKEIRPELIHKDDRAAAKEWYRRIYASLDEYAAVENETIKKKLVRYLIFNMRTVHKDVNKYHILYKCLYR